MTRFHQDGNSRHTHTHTHTHAHTTSTGAVPRYEYPALYGSKEGSNDKGKREFYCGQWFKYVHTLRTPAVYLPATVCMCVRHILYTVKLTGNAVSSNSLSTLRQQVHSKRKMLGSYVLCLFSDNVSRTVVPKLCSMDPNGSATSSQGIRGYTSVMATFNSNKSTNQMQQFLQFITWRLFIAQHVSGFLTPIIRSSTPAVAASGFTFGASW